MKFRIASAMGLVMLAGLASASIRAASPAWADATLSATLALLTAAVVAASCSRGRRRAYWMGFAVGGVIYLTFALGPFLEDPVGSRLATTAVLDLAYPHVARPPEPPEPPPPGTVRTFGWSGTDFAIQRADGEAMKRWYTSNGLEYDFYGWGATRFHSPGEFRRIGHSWFAWLAASLVGMASARFFDTRTREDAGP